MKMKTITRYLTYIGIVIISGFISGCFSMPRVYGTKIRPIYPTMNYSLANRFKTIDTLTLELKWTDIKKPNQTYDLCIWKTGSPNDSLHWAPFKGFTAAPGSWGTIIYYTNNIAENFHQINHPLEPNTYYNWAVRIREDEKVQAWSAFSQAEDKAVVSVDTHNVPFGFKTGDIKP